MRLRSCKPGNINRVCGFIRFERVSTVQGFVGHLRVFKTLGFGVLWNLERHYRPLQELDRDLRKRFIAEVLTVGQ